MHSYFSLSHTAQLRSRFSAQNFCSLRSRNTARNLCLVLRSVFRFVSTGASLGHFLPRFRTCVSVHRRDRCTRTPFPPTLHILVPVSLSLGHFPVRFLRTGVSVHRRYRCTCTFSLLALFVACFASSFSVLVVFLYLCVCP